MNINTNKEYFIRAFQFLEEKYIITSNVTGRRFKKISDYYYWCKDMQSCNRGEWNLCESNEGLFTVDEIKGNWII